MFMAAMMAASSLAATRASNARDLSPDMTVMQEGRLEGRHGYERVG